MSEKQLETITVKLTAEDYAGFNLYHGRRQLAGLFFFYCCLFVLVFLFSGIMGEEPHLAVVLLTAIGLSALLLVFQLWRIRVRTAKIFDSDKVSKLEQRICLTDTGMQHTTGDTTVRVPWEDIFRVAETKKAIILYLARNKVVLLPKRDVADLAGVKEMLSRNLPAAKLRLKAE